MVKICKAKLEREDFDLEADFLFFARDYFPALSILPWKNIPPRIKGAVMKAYNEIAKDKRNNFYYSDIKEEEFTKHSNYPLNNSDDFKRVQPSRYGKFTNFGIEELRV